MIQNLSRHDIPQALGVYQEGDPEWTSSHEIFTKCVALCRHLSKELARGERVGLMGMPEPDWMAIDLAIQGAGGVCVPIFVNVAPSILGDQLRASGIRRLFLLETISEDQAHQLQGVEIFVPSRLSVPSMPGVRPFPPCSEILSQDETLRLANGIAEKLTPDQPATLIFTSGSTGEPKGVPLTHANLVSQVRGATALFPMGPQDKALSFLPLAHVFERMVAYTYLAQGTSILFVHHPKSLPKAMSAYRPSVMTAVPRLLEKVYGAIRSGAETKSGLPLKLAKWTLHLALTHHTDAPKPFLAWFVADRLAYRKMRAALGGKLRMLIVGGAPLNKGLARFFTNIGIPTYQGYGLTECSPVLATNHPGRDRPGSVGPAFPGVQLRIDPVSEEVLAKGPGIFEGYHDGDRSCFDEKNWFHTGDRGRIDEAGFLFITGRIKERVKTSNGKYVSPVAIEQQICLHPWIEYALVIAESRPFVTALLCPNPERIPLAILQALKENPGHHVPPHLMKDFQKHLDQINLKLNPWERVQKVQWLSSPFTVESGELTPTLKVRRHIVVKKYLNLIDALYNE